MKNATPPTPSKCQYNHSGLPGLKPMQCFAIGAHGLPLLSLPQFLPRAPQSLTLSSFCYGVDPAEP